MNQDKIVSDLFKSMELIADKKIQEVDFPTILIGTVIERILNSDSYSIQYLNTEITASSIGGLYQKGDEVFIIIPDGINKTKFILGKTNNRTPTFTFNESGGLSEKDLLKIQEIIQEIQDLTSDNIVSPVEKQSLLIQWESIKKSYEEIMILKTPYEDEVNTEALTTVFERLSIEFDKILLNMNESTEINGEEFRTLVLSYLQLDKQARLDLQEALRNELTYKVDIFSSNGEAFKNNVINTNLTASIMRGKNNITNTILQDSIIWNKLDGTGSIIPGWSFTGHTVTITQDDVNGKQIFQVIVKVEEAEVAKDMVTIVDLNDIGSLSLACEVKESKTQVYKPEDKTFEPNYEVKNQVLTASTSYAGKDITSKTAFKWLYDGVDIVTDSRFTVSGNKLTIKKNLMNTETVPNMVLTLLATYYMSEYQVSLEEQTVIDFSCVKNGETPILATILAPKGTVIKNEGHDLQATYVLKKGDEILTPTKIEWFLSEDALTWTPISLSSNMNTIVILRETINGVLHVKSIGQYNGETYESPVISFADLLDSVNVSVIGSGTFKDNGTNTYTADVFLGQELINNPEEFYDIVWSVVNEQMRVSLFNTSWPKRGKKITVMSSEVPDNPGIALIVNVFKKEE